MWCVYLSMTNFYRPPASESFPPPQSKQSADYTLSPDPRREEKRVAALERKAEFKRTLRGMDIMERCVTTCPTIRMLIAGCEADTARATNSDTLQEQLAENHALRMQRLSTVATCSGHIVTQEVVRDPDGQDVILPIDSCTGTSYAPAISDVPAIPLELQSV